MKYEQFRTGMTFKQIRAELRAEADAKYQAGQYMFVTRRTVLGRWHQHKQDQWHHYLNHSQGEHENTNHYTGSDHAAGGSNSRSTVALRNL